MTTTAITTSDRPATAGTALSLRRWALVSAPVLGGLFTTFGVLMDPAAGISGKEMYDIYGAEPGPLQFKSLGLHYGYAFLVLPALLIPRLVRGRGAAIANLGAVLGFIGLSTLPGLLFVDFYDSAIAELYGADGAVAVSEEMETMWGVLAMAVPGLVCSMIALAVAGVALWRAGLVRWWAPLAALLVFPAFAVGNATWPSGLLMTALLAIFSFALYRADRGATLPA